MKRLLKIFLFCSLLFATLQGYSQLGVGERTPNNSKGVNFKELSADSLMRLPKDTFLLPHRDTGSLAFKNNLVYVWNRHPDTGQYKWDLVTGQVDLSTLPTLGWHAETGFDSLMRKLGPKFFNLRELNVDWAGWGMNDNRTGTNDSEIVHVLRVDTTKFLLYGTPIINSRLEMFRVLHQPMARPWYGITQIAPGSLDR
jgi:hypothetical protein